MILISKIGFMLRLCFLYIKKNYKLVLGSLYFLTWPENLIKKIKCSILNRRILRKTNIIKTMKQKFKGNPGNWIAPRGSLNNFTVSMEAPLHGIWNYDN